ncbi:phage tail tube protein [Domibacillus tundrae]|uniref:phage tail tube protein n=1 Tax=Domibacillus tundrae TaxID=1587527 RepID=UPI0006180119|nr:phage tail tube protein [Domibacillus tundrae]
MAFRSGNTINGREGRLFFEGDEVAYTKSYEATIEKNKTEVPVLGRRMMGHKTIGASGSGTLVVYKVTSKFVRLMADYVNKGEDPYFTFQEVLDDKASGRGTERVTISDVNFDSAKVAGLNAEGEVLEEELPFTFEGIELPEELAEGF